MPGERKKVGGGEENSSIPLPPRPATAPLRSSKRGKKHVKNLPAVWRHGRRVGTTAPITPSPQSSGCEGCSLGPDGSGLPTLASPFCWPERGVLQWGSCVLSRPQKALRTRPFGMPTFSRGLQMLPFGPLPPSRWELYFFYHTWLFSGTRQLLESIPRNSWRLISAII